MCEAPDNLMVKFNYAFVLQKLATQTLRDEKSSLEMVTGAVEDLKTAERFHFKVHFMRLNVCIYEGKH